MKAKFHLASKYAEENNYCDGAVFLAGYEACENRNTGGSMKLPKLPVALQWANIKTLWRYELPEAVQVPKWYGIAWVNYWRGTAVCYPIFYSWIFRLGYLTLCFFKYPFPQTNREKMLYEATQLAKRRVRDKVYTAVLVGKMSELRERIDAIFR